MTPLEPNRIILTRPAVEAGERLGFLPGDLQSKVDPYLRQLADLILLTAPGQADDIAHGLFADVLPPAGEGQKGVEGLDGQHGILRLAGDTAS